MSHLLSSDSCGKSCEGACSGGTDGAVAKECGKAETQPSKRVARSVRKYVLERDDWTCQYCGLWMSRTEATVDHVQPWSLDGTGYGMNLRACCRRCNLMKADKSEAYLRMALAFAATPWAKFISLEQFHQIRGAGADLPELHVAPFYFEQKGKDAK